MIYICRRETKLKMEHSVGSSKGIVVKLWDIKNNKGADGKSDIRASINYISDDEKTSVEAESIDLNVQNTIDYATNDLKTMHKALVGTYLISDIDKAAQEMTDVKTIFGKTKGRSAIHGIISLDSNESDIENAGKLISMTRDILCELFPNHQFVYAVHTNTENLHIHFIVNSVGMDGHKIHRANDFFQNVLQPTVYNKAIEYGFTPNTRWIERRQPDQLSFPERKALLRRDIDEAIEKSINFDEFCSSLRDKGYVVNVGKHISLQNDQMQKAIRTKQLGSRYTVEAITERIAHKLADFIYVKASNHTDVIQFEENSFKVTKMPKYKDMTKEEQQEVVKLLKQGRNPWQEHYIRSWQYQQLNRKIQLEANAHKVVAAYSADGNIPQALDEIIHRQKLISYEKKIINSNLRDYKPIRDIYSQMQAVQVRAYLYEFCGSSEYEEEYEEYMSLVKRLKEGYNKTPEDVYDFLCDQQNQLLYLEAQRKELNTEYKAVRKYLVEDVYMAHKVGIKLNLAEISNYKNEVMEADRTGQTVADTAYLASSGGQYIVRMTKSVYIDEKGKPKQNVEFVVLDRYGTILESIAMKESANLKEFNKQVNDITKRYGLTDCYKRNDFKEAVDLLGLERDTDMEANKTRKLA